MDFKLPPAPRLRPETFASLERYWERGISPGGFLEAVLCNDLFKAMSLADEESRQELFEICTYIYSFFPGNAWRSEAKMLAHMDRRYEEEEERREKNRSYDETPGEKTWVMRGNDD